jgi:hypothetical protein
LGKVGASVPAGTSGYRIAQALPKRNRDNCRLLCLARFRLATNAASAPEASVVDWSASVFALNRLFSGPIT